MLFMVQRNYEELQYILKGGEYAGTVLRCSCEEQGTSVLV